MTLRQLIELTAIASINSPHVIESPAGPPRDALTRYWGCFKAAQRNWLNRLAAYPGEANCVSASERPKLWQRTEPILSEVFATELVARVWGAILTAGDRLRGTCDAEPFARNVLLGQLEARHLALRLMVNGPHVTLDQIAGLDRLRRKLERWTDLLLGHISKRFGLTDFPFDFERSLEYGEDQLQTGYDPRRSQIWDLYLLSLHAAFPATPAPAGVAESIRREIIASIYAAFPSVAFFGDGPFKSIGLGRIEREGFLREGPPDASALVTVSPPATKIPVADDLEECFPKLASRSKPLFRPGAD